MCGASRCGQPFIIEKLSNWSLLFSPHLVSSLLFSPLVISRVAPAVRCTECWVLQSPFNRGVRLSTAFRFRVRRPIGQRRRCRLYCTKHCMECLPAAADILSSLLSTRHTLGFYSSPQIGDIREAPLGASASPNSSGGQSPSRTRSLVSTGIMI